MLTADLSFKVVKQRLQDCGSTGPMDLEHIPHLEDSRGELSRRSDITNSCLFVHELTAQLRIPWFLSFFTTTKSESNGQTGSSSDQSTQKIVGHIVSNVPEAPRALLAIDSVSLRK